MKKILVALAIALSSRAHAASILHLEGRAFFQNDRASEPAARGLEIPADTHLVLEKDSQILVQISESASLEIKGPARASLSEGLFWNLESGRFLVFSRGLSLHRFRILQDMVRPDNTSFEVEIPLAREYAQVLVMWGSVSLFGEELEAKRLYVLQNSQAHEGQISQDELIKRRQTYPFSQPLFKHLEEGEIPVSLRNQVSLSQLTGVNRFTEVGAGEAPSSSTFLGMRAEWIHKRYLNFPRRPQRLHFLRSPALRLGAGTTYFSSGNVSNEGSTQVFSAHALVGASWRGLAIDGLVGYAQPQTEDATNSSPLTYGVRALYEWDLSEVTASDLMLGLGYSYGVSKVTSYAVFQSVTQALNFAFILNF